METVKYGPCSGSGCRPGYVRVSGYAKCPECGYSVIVSDDGLLAPHDRALLGELKRRLGENLLALAREQGQLGGMADSDRAKFYRGMIAALREIQTWDAEGRQ
jgi:hypothetical protein